MCLALRSQSKHCSHQITYQDQSTPNTWPYLMMRFPLRISLAAASLVALSPGYIVDFDPEDESEDGPTDYPANEGDDNDESSGDDADDEDEEEASEEDEEEEEKEHLAPIDFVKETKPFKTDELFAIPTPPPSPLTSLSSSLSQIPSPPFPEPSPPATSPTYAEAPLGFRVAKIWLRAASPLPSPPLPPPSSPLLPPVDRGESSTAAAAKQSGLRAARTTDYGFVDMVGDVPRRHVPRKVGYDITDTWDELVDAIQEGASTTLERVNARVTELDETHERDTQDLYAHLKDAQDNRACLSGRVDTLLEDRQFHQAKVTAIEESKYLTSLSLDELIRNLKVYEMIIKKYFEIVKAKVERKSVALKAKKESSDEECSIFGSKDEEYAMAVRDFKKFFKRKDAVTRIILMENVQNHRKIRTKERLSEVLGGDSGEEDDEKVKNETCLVAQASSKEIRSRNMCLIQSLDSKELVINLPKLKFDQHFCDACKIEKQAQASHKAKNIVLTTRCLELLHMDLFGPSSVRSYEGNRYTLVIVDGYSRKVEESLNVTFDETPSPSKTSPSVDDDLDEEEAIKINEKKNLENDVADETLEIDEIVNIKESRNHPLKMS
uniref:Retrovirus-related Pol polyprotein from transposon TNT 1-94 n=1 Tax=Tanacetum cinerariifolium TaxID=118510 RepID=A0A6L2KDZ3_TANCI|nr:retrovirus-related Pol polyprotein from transposon TNT 1-94 [Tanacetum cinerariifolium]